MPIEKTNTEAVVTRTNLLPIAKLVPSTKERLNLAAEFQKVSTSACVEIYRAARQARVST